MSDTYKPSFEVRFKRWAPRILFNVFLMGIVGLYVLDFIFFAAWAPHWYLVPVFVIFGVVFRSAAVFLGIIIDESKEVDENGKKIFSTENALLRFGQVCALAVCVAASVSFFVVEPQRAEGAGEIARQENSVDSSVNDELIANLRSEIASLESNRNDAVARKDATIIRIQTDGEEDEEEEFAAVNKLEAEITEIREKADKEIDAKRDEIKALIAQKGEGQKTVQHAENRSEGMELFQWVSDRGGYRQQDVTDFMLLFIVGALEYLLIWGFELLIKRRRRLDTNLARAEIEDRKRIALDKAELESGEIRAKNLVEMERKNAAREIETHRLEDQRREAEHQRQMMRDKLILEAQNHKAIEDAKKEAAELRGEPLPEPEPVDEDEERRKRSIAAQKGAVTRQSNGHDDSIPAPAPDWELA